ncbi:MAG: DUF2268 domain-containing putative Zn-dependent protease [Pseudomonadota bacterium]
MSVDIHIFDRSDRFGAQRPTIDAALSAGADWVAARADGLSVDVVVAPTDFGTDQFVNAVAQGPANISMGIDIAALGDPTLYENVRCCMVHELHHAYRWPHIPRWSVAECLILEGLAKIADIEAFRAAVPDAPMPGWTIADADAVRDDVGRLKNTAMEDARDWLYTPEPAASPHVPMRIYAVGLDLMLRATHALRLDPWQAATRDAATLMAAADTGTPTPDDIWCPA